MKIMFTLLFVACVSLCTVGSCAEEMLKKEDIGNAEAGKDDIVKGKVKKAKKHKKLIKMDEPMKTGMMKDGMMKGDVKISAEKKDKEMQLMMDKEEKSMQQNKDKP